MGNDMSIIELWQLLREKARVIMLFVVLWTAVFTLYTFFIATPQYSSTTQLLVNQTRGEQSSIDISDINTNVRLVDTYKELITGPAILNKVSDELQADLSTDQLSAMISVNSPQDAQLFNLTATSSDPLFSAEIANTVALIFQREIGEIMNSVDNVVITFAAEPRVDPISPNHVIHVLVGLVLGTMSGIVVVLTQNALDGTFRDIDFITDEIGWIDLGSIYEITPDSQRLQKKKTDLK